VKRSTTATGLGLALVLATWVLSAGGCASILGVEEQTMSGADGGEAGVATDATTGDGTASEGSGSSSGGKVEASAAADAGDAGKGFTIAAPASLMLQQGASAPVTVTVARGGGFTDAIAVTVSGLPAGASASPLTITSDTTSGPLTIAVGSATPQGVSHLVIDGVAASGAVSASAQMDLVVRGPPGSLDSLYGSGGVVSGFLTTTNFGTFEAATLDANDDVLIAIDSALGENAVSVVRITPAGVLDSTFGTAGIATPPNTGVFYYSMFPVPNGDVELCGFGGGNPWTDEYMRLMPTGAVDTSFSPDGGVGNSVLRTDGRPDVFTLDPTGRVVETGFTGNAQGFLLTRRTAAGPFDTTFDAGFAPTIPGQGGPTVIQPDGHIVASWLPDTPPYGMGLVRTDTSGNLDPTFGTNGVVPGTGPGDPSALILQPDGKLVTGGVTFTSAGLENPGGFTARYLSNGTIDVTYGSGGTAQVAAGNVFAMVQQSDQSVVAVGYPWPVGDAGAPTNDLWVERLTAGGVTDPSFGSGGTVTTPVGGAGEISMGEFVGLQSDGRIVVVVATLKSQGVYDFAVARYWP
jgi:uncharacterized delta-60 repeat protein